MRYNGGIWRCETLYMMEYNEIWGNMMEYSLDLRETLQETMVSKPLNKGVSCKLSLKPIQWNMDILYLSHVYIYIHIFPLLWQLRFKQHMHCDWNQNLWRLHFMGICNPFTWYVCLKMLWCIRNLWPFGWFISPLSKWYIYIYKNHQPNSTTDHKLS